MEGFPSKPLREFDCNIQNLIYAVLPGALCLVISGHRPAIATKLSGSLPIPLRASSRIVKRRIEHFENSNSYIDDAPEESRIPGRLIHSIYLLFLLLYIDQKACSSTLILPDLVEHHDKSCSFYYFIVRILPERRSRHIHYRFSASRTA